MILYKTKIVECMKSEDKKIVIESTNADYPFDEEKQISDVSVDLRLGETGYILSEDIDMINSLSESGFDDYFIKQTISVDGYLLQPGQIIFCPTLEVVKINDRCLLGFLCGRITYARIGLSVICDQVKVPFGYNSVIGLQIKNNTAVPIRIYFRQKIAQIMFMEVSPASGPYKGAYADLPYRHPIISDSEKSFYSDLEWKNIQKIKSKRKYIVPNTIKKRYEWLQKYHKVKLSIWIACWTGVITGIVLPYQLSPTSYTEKIYINVLTIVGIIMLLLVAIDLVVDYVLFTKKIKDNENE